MKKKVIDYWENHLRIEASNLSSLEFFRPSHMSLSVTHPLWTTAGASSTRVAMASCQALMLSGRYRTQKLCSNWDNSNGYCRLSLSCNTIEDITHILKTCSALDKTRDKLKTFTKIYCQDKPDIHDLIHTHCSPDRDSFCQFILDCSVLPDVINAVQINGQEILNQLFTLTRIWCYSLHRDRLKLLGRWPFINNK